jgi:hypothetical protein
MIPGGVLLDVEPGTLANRNRNAHRAVGIWRVVAGKAARVARLELAELPTRENGAEMKGPAEAWPLWDAVGECLVVTNGSDPELIIGSTSSSAVDTVTFPLTDRPAPRQGGAVQGVPWPEPSAQRRIRDLVADPDGWIWLLPVQPDSSAIAGVEVIQVNIEDRTSVTDTVPAFPIEFGPPGVFFATTTDESGIRRLTVFGTPQM